MTAPRPVVPEDSLLGRSFYVPTFDVKMQADGDFVHDVADVTYTDSVERPARFRMTVMNYDTEKRRLKYLDDTTFSPGKDIEIYLGYHHQGPLLRVLKGTIERLDPSFPESGVPTLKVSGMSRLHALERQQRHKVWKKPGGEITDSEIAQQIAGLNNIAAEIERSDVGHRAVIQDNQYDLAFLRERASWIGYEVVYDSEADKLYFRKSTAVTRRTLTLSWGRSLMSFKPKLTTRDQVKQVKVRWWDPKADKAKEVTVSRESLEMPGLKGSKMSSSIKRSLSKATEVVIDQPVHSEAEARRVAREKLQKIVKEMQTCEGQTVGLPELRAGTLVEIGEVGDTFGGLYFVTSTTHSIGAGGYTVDFEGRREVK